MRQTAGCTVFLRNRKFTVLPGNRRHSIFINSVCIGRKEANLQKLHSA